MTDLNKLPAKTKKLIMDLTAAIENAEYVMLRSQIAIRRLREERTKLERMSMEEN